jgi:flagellar biosynthesis protein FlhA
VRLSDDFSIPPKCYQIKIHGTVVAEYQMRVGELMVLLGAGPLPEMPGEEVREPAFGMRAYSVSEAFAEDLKREKLTSADNMSVLLTHLSEVIRNNLPQLLSYKDMKALIERLDPEYRKLTDEICTSHISYPGLQAVLKLLLAERVSIRNLHLIIEAIAEIAPHVRRTEQIVEHVRIRMAQQICGDLTEGALLKVLRLGNRWDLAFHQALKRDQKGDIREFDIDPRLLEEFGQEVGKAVRTHLEAGERFVLVSAPDARPYVRMIVERLFPTLPILSHVEIARGVEVRVLGAVS